MKDAHKRIDMYHNPFFGWSSYHVEGAFLTRKRKRLDDELTQIIRIIFRFESKYERHAQRKGCWQILRSIASWLLINEYHRTDQVLPWSDVQRERFIGEHGLVSENELAYIKRYYVHIAREVMKWFDDAALLAFGFLVRRFWKRVAEVGYKEDQIWVTSFFNLGINVVKPVGTRPPAKPVLS